MNAEYIKTLENRIEELQDIVSSYNPTMYNIMDTYINIKARYIENNNIRYGWMNMSPRILLKDFFTIRINAGRQLGHSIAFYKLYTKDPINNLMIVHHKHLLTNFPGSQHLDYIDRQGTSLTSKLILADGFLDMTDDYRTRLYDCIVKKTLWNSSSIIPIIVMT